MELSSLMWNNKDCKCIIIVVGVQIGWTWSELNHVSQNSENRMDVGPFGNETVTRLGNLLDFGQLFKGFGNN